MLYSYLYFFFTTEPPTTLLTVSAGENRVLTFPDNSVKLTAYALPVAATGESSITACVISDLSHMSHSLVLSKPLILLAVQPNSTKLVARVIMILICPDINSHIKY